MKEKKYVCLAVFFIMLVTILALSTISFAANGTGHTTHSYTKFVKVVSSATCTKAAVYRYQCTGCSLTQDRSVGNALGHNYKAATCTEAQQCTRCGVKVGGPLGHSYAAATCTKPKTCTRCSATSGSALGHSYKEATCTEAKYCTRCKVKVGGPLGHSYAAATCTKPKTCTRCSATSGSALGHTPASGWESVAQKHYQVCTRCNQMINEADHKFVAEQAHKPISTADKCKEITKYDRCTICNYKTSITTTLDTTHDYSSGTGSCKDCGYQPTSTTHTFVAASAWTSDDTYHWHRCAVSGCTISSHISSKIIHTWGEWKISATNRRYHQCTVCNRVVYEETVTLKPLTITGASVVYLNESISLGTSPSTTVTWKVQQSGGLGTLSSTTGVSNKLKGTRVGQVAITATATGFEPATKIITVIEKPNTTQSPSLSPQSKSITLYVGQTGSVAFNYNGNGSFMIASNSNSTIATAKLSGKILQVSGLKAGQTVVKLSLSANGDYTSATATVTVNVLERQTTPTASTTQSPDLVQQSKNITLYVGEKQVVAFMYNGNGILSIGGNSNAGIVTPKINGKTLEVTGLKVGQSIITVNLSSSGNYEAASAKVTVNVIEKPVISEDPSTPVSIDLTAFFKNEILANGSQVEGDRGELIDLLAEPQENVAFITYFWDKEEPIQMINGANATITIPDDFKPGTTHKLYIQAIGTEGQKSETKIYTFTIPNLADPENTPLEVLPWEEENYEIQQLGISLRNDSESSKANKNIYALYEDVTYKIDFKNGGDTINETVKITLQIPLDFEIVQHGGGTVDQSARTITWIYPNGMVKDYSGTKTVVLRYISLSNNANAETIYPLAKIIVGRQVKDNSAVINYIYRDSESVIDEVHSPYMYGDANATTFRPDDTITRAEGALVLVRILLGQDVIDRTPVSYVFPDINETYLEAQKAITAATEYGIINGYTDGTYKPNRIMTRAEFMKILATYLEINSRRNNIEGLQIKEINEAVKLYNNPVSEYIVNGQIVKHHWAIEEISLLIRLNMTSVSIFETDLRIDKGITRAEVAQLVNFHLLRAPVEVNGYIPTGFSDVNIEHHLIGDILEATRAQHHYRIIREGKEIAE